MRGREPALKRYFLTLNLTKKIQKIKAQHAAAKKVIDNCETLDRPKYKPKRPKSINMGACASIKNKNNVYRVFYRVFV